MTLSVWLTPPQSPPKYHHLLPLRYWIVVNNHINPPRRSFLLVLCDLFHDLSPAADLRWHLGAAISCWPRRLMNPSPRSVFAVKRHNNCQAFQTSGGPAICRRLHQRHLSDNPASHPESNAVTAAAAPGWRTFTRACRCHRDVKPWNSFSTHHGMGKDTEDVVSKAPFGSSTFFYSH